MKSKLLLIGMVFLFIVGILPVSAQNFTFEAEETYLQQAAGVDTVVFHAWVKNTSGSEVTIQGHRTVIHAPHDWASSMCFGLCFPETTDDTYPYPIAAGDSVEFELDVFIRDASEDYSEIQIRMEDVNNTDDYIEIVFITDTRPVSVTGETTRAKQFILEQNYPNPFNPETTIDYYLPELSDVKLTIFNSIGQKIKELVNLRESAGSYSVKWNGTDDFGRPVASGLYFYKLEAGHFTKINKMVLIK